MNHRLTAYVALLAVSIIWGVAGPVIKFTLGEFPPLVFLTYRFALSAAVALIAFAMSRPRIPRSTGESSSILLYGFLTSTVGLGLLFLGFNKTTALTGTLLSAVSPVLVAIAGVLFLKERVTKTERIGLAIACLGTIFTVLEPMFESNGRALTATIEGNLLVIASLLVGVILSVQSKLLLRNHTSPATLTHISFLVGLVTILPVTLWQYSPREIITFLNQAPIAAHVGVWYMAFLSGTLAYTLWHKGQKAIEISEATVFAYLYPVWATPLSVLWLGEAITPGFTIGAAIIAIGVIVAEYKRRSGYGKHTNRSARRVRRRARKR